MDQEHQKARNLLVAIRNEASADERLRLIQELENVPVHRLHFHDRWTRIHAPEFPFDCWEEDGYYPERSTLPRDVQLLMGMMYGKSDIENGGFHQFFTNSTGRLAPEMVEWCERSNLLEAAILIREAMSFFGLIYPRSDDLRRARLDWPPSECQREIYEDQDRSEWDPFYRWDDRFYEDIFPHKADSFDHAADQWLKCICGINNLSAPPV